MKSKTISKVIKLKLENWLNSITDEKLRERVKSNVLVSGGAIASMYLKEEVNDYDIYIQDMDVLYDLCEYYLPSTALDGRKRLTYLNEAYPNIDHNNPLTPDGDSYVAEKYVRLSNLKANQIKLNVSGTGVKKELKPITNLIEFAKSYRVKFVSQNAISLENDVQIVVRFSGTVEEIHKTFDFIHATNYFTFKDGLVLNLAAMESLITKNLVYQGSLYPLTSIIRMKKFIGRHWTMNAGEVLKIMFQISDLNLRDIVVLEEQLIGVDVAYFSELITALRGVDTKNMTLSYINTLIDKIFNSMDD